MIEIFAVIFSLAAVFLAYRSSVLYWPIGLIGIFFYFIIFKSNRDWINMSIQFVFVIQSLIGWFKWIKEDKISCLGNKSILFLFFPLWICLYLISNYFDGNNPILDSLSSSLALFASCLMIYRKVESWIFWIVCDISMILLFVSDKLWISSFVYFIFLIICIFGFFKWKRDVEKV